MSTEPNFTDTVTDLRKSFSYGSRCNLNFSFLADLKDDQFKDFLDELFEAVSGTTDTGDATDIIDVTYRWQVEALRDHLGDQNNFPHRHDDTPWAPLTKPLSESRIALITSSGHFVEGDDPKPLGVENMTQAEAEARIMEMIKEPPSLSVIPSSTAFENIRVRHGGYPVAGAKADPQVVLPLRIMEDLAADGTIGEFAETSYSFVGAAAQGPIKKRIGAQWAQMLHDHQIDAVLLVPI